MGLFRDSPNDTPSATGRSSSNNWSGSSSDSDYTPLTTAEKNKASAASKKRFEERQAAADQEAKDSASNIWGGIGGAIGSLFGPGGAAAGNKLGSYFGAENAKPANLYAGDKPGGAAGMQSGYNSPFNNGFTSRGSNSGNQAVGFTSGSPSPYSNYGLTGNYEMDRQNAFLQDTGALYKPSIQRGEQAQSTLYDYYSGNQKAMQDQVNQSVTDSPFLAQNIALGEKAVARNEGATGGFRSGTMQENLAKNSQDVYQDLYNQQLQSNLQGLGMFSDYGANAVNNYANFGSNMINQLGTTAGTIESQRIAQDAADKNQQTALIGALAGGLGSYFGG